MTGPAYLAISVCDDNELIRIRRAPQMNKGTCFSLKMKGRISMKTMDEDMDLLTPDSRRAIGKAMPGESILDQDFMSKFMRLCNDGWEQGWHERNGGNLTYRMRKHEVEASAPFFDDKPGEWVSLGIEAVNLAGEFFVITGAGRYMRNVINNPFANLGIVELNEKGNAYRMRWGLESGGRPTSELPTHIMNHSIRFDKTDGGCRVIYHAHPSNIIAMTFVLPLDARTFTRALWKAMTECVLVFPTGVGVVPWMVPGGADIALATSELFKEYDAAVWSQHGLFVSGPDFDETFGLMHTIEKAADIYMRARCMNGGSGDFLNTISDDGLRAIGKQFGIEINEKFLE